MKLRFLPVTLASLCLATCAAWSQFTLSTSVTGGGHIVRSPALSPYPANSTVTLWPLPAAGWQFTGWSGDAGGAANPLPLVMSANKTVTANFTSLTPDVIVDNASATFTGTWVLDAGSAGTGFFASDFRYASTVSFPNATANFRPNLPMTGNYDVYVWYPDLIQGGRRCRDARHLVYFDGGAEPVSVDQMNGASKWRLLASGKRFQAGTSGYVEISNQSSDQGDFVSADALRWVWSANQPVGPMPRLSIELLPSRAVRVFWTRPADGYLLEEAGTITSSPVTGWSVVAPSTYQMNATHVSITIPMPTGMRIYRLRQ